MVSGSEREPPNLCIRLRIGKWAAAQRKSKIELDNKVIILKTVAGISLKYICQVKGIISDTIILI